MALGKFSVVGQLLAKVNGTAFTDEAACRQSLVETLTVWTERIHFPRFSDFGLNEDLSAEIVQATSNRQNPAKLSKAVLARILNEVL